MVADTPLAPERKGELSDVHLWPKDPGTGLGCVTRPEALDCLPVLGGWLLRRDGISTRCAHGFDTCCVRHCCTKRIKVRAIYAAGREI